ncbi:MAG TPA: GAF domain-containing sensor histidine kinase [Solirubrobacteraceae bacterium]|nr:GAF domain-containing sensor histidine kinase [Solirubrobacteraceae bacterium]
MSALGLPGSASSRQLPLHRPTALALAVTGPLLIGLGSLPFRSSFGLACVLLCVLLVVVGVAVTGGAGPALVAVVIGFAVGVSLFTNLSGKLAFHPGDAVALVAFAVVGAVLSVVIDEFVVLADERGALMALEAALRRVATVVAQGAEPAEVFAAVAEGVGQLLAADFAYMGRYGSDGAMTVIAAWPGAPSSAPIGSQFALGGSNLGTRVFETGQTTRFDSLADASGPVGIAARESGFKSAVGTPIIVEGRRWGVMAVGSRLEHGLPEDTELRLVQFTELLATAVANAESRSELSASRSRIVAAADETRRRIERDLHDRAQQRLVSLMLELHAAQTAEPLEVGELTRQLARTGEGLAEVLEELREISRGIHPAILSEGGLEPALRALARRSPVPVTLDLHAERRSPEQVEVAMYYVASEALTNAAKHAHASTVNVELDAHGGTLRLAIRDDGTGGADPGHGSGLLGLSDRIEALGGTLEVSSPSGGGTALLIEVPTSASPRGSAR